MGAIHYMQVSSPGWADGFVTKVSASGQPDNHQEWTQDDTTMVATIYNPQVTYHEKVLLGTSSQTVRTEFTYAATTDYSGNVKEIREYAFSGSLRRKTTFNYLHEANSAYVPLNILDRVTDNLIYNGSNVLVAKTVTAYDIWSPLPTADGAIRHDTAFGPTYTTRGLPTAVTKWYDLANNLSLVNWTKFDECGNPREITDPKYYTTSLFYWLSSADNAYAFPLRVVNPKGHETRATYSY